MLNWEELFQSTMVLFAVVDIIGSIPVLVDVKSKAGDIHAGRASLVALGIMLAFLLLGPVVDLKLAGLFTVLMRPRAIAITASAASLGVLLIGQWVNLWQL